MADSFIIQDGDTTARGTSIDVAFSKLPQHVVRMINGQDVPARGLRRLYDAERDERPDVVRVHGA